MAVQQPGFQPKIHNPPTTGNQAVDHWLRDLAIVVNNLPRLSWFSGTTPNSVVTGTAGDIAVNLASGSTTTRLWVMGGAPSFVTNKGWITLATGPA
jgi:hypothetical protein